jgi:hypothetical protein
MPTSTPSHPGQFQVYTPPDDPSVPLNLKLAMSGTVPQILLVDQHGTTRVTLGEFRDGVFYTWSGCSGIPGLKTDADGYLECVKY